MAEGQLIKEEVERSSLTCQSHLHGDSFWERMHTEAEDLKLISLKWSLFLYLWEILIYPRSKKPGIKITYFKRLGGAPGLQVATPIMAWRYSWCCNALSIFLDFSGGTPVQKIAVRLSTDLR